MIFDIHTHVIPHVDDGAQSVEEAIEILKLLKQQGVQKVIATPHFYAAKSSIDLYLDRVSKEYQGLLEAIRGKDLPEVLLGYEVYYFRGMSKNDSLNRLCIGNSNYLLLELPYKALDDKIIDDINDIVLNQEITPILAHVERYLQFNKLDRLLSLFQYGDIEGQINADSLFRGIHKKKALQLMEHGFCRFIGSDAHNLNTRSPHIDKMAELLKKKLSKDAIGALEQAWTELYGAISGKHA